MGNFGNIGVFRPIKETMIEAGEPKKKNQMLSRVGEAVRESKNAATSHMMIIIGGKPT
jgi:hypothetical protein